MKALEKNDLYLLDDIIVNKLNPINISGVDSIETILEIVDSARISADLNKRYLITEAFKIKNGSTIEQVVHNFQERFIVLSNLLHESLKKKNTYSKHLITIDKLIDDLIRFIQTFFSKRFNYNLEVPAKTKINKISDYNKYINDKIYKLNPEKTELLSIALNPFEILCSESSTPLTFYDINYLETHLTIIYNSIKQSESGYFDEILTKKLIQNNFNTFHFSVYLIHKIKYEISNCNNSIEQINLYNWHIKSLRQTYLNRDSPYILNCKSIVALVIDWINCELMYFPKEQNSENQSEIINSNKIPLNMTVPLTSAFAGLLWKVQLINCDNAKELSRIISQNCKTSNADHISAESIYNNYFKTNQATKDDLKDVIFKLMHEVNKL